jgi:hypothetical protein
MEFDHVWCSALDHPRFLQAAAAGITAETIPTGAAAEQARPTKSAKWVSAGSNSSFAALKLINIVRS